MTIRLSTGEGGGENTPINHPIHSIQPKIDQTRERQVLRLVLDNGEHAREDGADPRCDGDGATAAEEARLHKVCAEKRACNTYCRGDGPVAVGLVGASGAEFGAVGFEVVGEEDDVDWVSGWFDFRNQIL